ncbi:MAG: hypothetical protein ACFFAU_06590 [Candidatus Hodarchaeota archaeon]
MGKEEQINKFRNKITSHSTTLLMIAVIIYFFTLLIGFAPTYDTSYQVNGSVGFFVGSTTLGKENLFVFTGLGSLIAVIEVILMAFVRLFAGLSFAAVCFDESKNIWFRVVAVAALMLIMFGGLNIM